MPQYISMFSSDYRMTYTQDVLNAIAAPIGHVIHWRYDKELVWDKDPKSLESLTALLWYVHMDRQAPAEDPIPMGYVPLRLAKVLSVHEELGFVFFKMELGRFVRPRQDYDTTWNDYVTSSRHEQMTSNGNLRSREPLPLKTLVMRTEGLTSLVEDDNCWRTVTDEVYRHLQEHVAHRKVTFFKVDSLQRIARWSTSVPYDSVAEQYQLLEDQWYELRYSLRKMDKTPDVSGNYVTLSTTSSENIYCATANPQAIGSPYDYRVVRFRPRPMPAVGRGYGFVSLMTKAPIDGLDLQFDVEIKPKWLSRFGASLWLAVGVALAAIPGLMSDDTAFTTKATVLGGAMVAFILIRTFLGESTAK